MPPAVLETWAAHKHSSTLGKLTSVFQCAGTNCPRSISERLHSSTCEALAAHAHLVSPTPQGTNSPVTMMEFPLERANSNMKILTEYPPVQWERASLRAPKLSRLITRRLSGPQTLSTLCGSPDDHPKRWKIWDREFFLVSSIAASAIPE